MADPYIGEIKMFSGNYAPRGWALCEGQLMSVNEMDTLYSLLGTTYGGDGRTTFALPDLRGRIPVHQGTGPGLSTHPIGQMVGTEQVILTETQMPNHNHQLMASSNDADSLTLNGKVLAKTPPGDNFYAPGAPDNQVDLIDGSIEPSGGNQPHSNIMPFLCINFIIALVGIYPPRH